MGPVITGGSGLFFLERGEYELANSRSANVYLQSMADAARSGLGAALRWGGLD